MKKKKSRLKIYKSVAVPVNDDLENLKDLLSTHDYTETNLSQGETKGDRSLEVVIYPEIIMFLIEHEYLEQEDLEFLVKNKVDAIEFYEDF